MASRKTSDRIREWLAAHALERVTEAVFEQLVREFPEIKARTIRKAARESGLKLDAMVEGVRQDSLTELERTLVALQMKYQDAGADRTRRQRIRSLVIESKTHARFAALRKPDKQEMVEWMLVWLNDPALFDTWVRLRIRSLDELEASRVADPDAGHTEQH